MYVDKFLLMNFFFGLVFWLLVMLGVLVIFYEFGYFWVVCCCGVKVLCFLVGFGWVIWKCIVCNGIEYQVVMILLGGYVKMFDVCEGDVDFVLCDQEFIVKLVWKCIVIVVVGFGFNFIFMLVVFWVMFMFGWFDVVLVVIVVLYSMVVEVGICLGDCVFSVGGQCVMIWIGVMDDFVDVLFGCELFSMQVCSVDGMECVILLLLDWLLVGQDVGQYFDMFGLLLVLVVLIVGMVMFGLFVVKVGMCVGDCIVSVNGIVVDDYVQFQKLILEQVVKLFLFIVIVQCNGVMVLFIVVVEQVLFEGQLVCWVIGVELQLCELVIQYYGLFKVFSVLFGIIWSSVVQIFCMIGKMFIGEVFIKNFFGVIGIVQVVNQLVSMGLAWFFNFFGMVLLSLCIFNLLLILFLDGGYLLYYFIELVKGSLVSECIMIVGQYVGFVLLFMMMGLVFYNDLYCILLL